MSKPSVVLYHFDSCPFCRRVRRFLEAEQLSIPMKDIQLDPSAQEELLRVTGKTQVPCLFIDGQPLFESLDIIQWFKDNWK